MKDVRNSLDDISGYKWVGNDGPFKIEIFLHWKRIKGEISTLFLSLMLNMYY